MNKRYSVTQSQYNALLKGGVARSCGSCGHEVPKYVGRYSSSCNSCEDGVLSVPQADEDKKESIDGAISDILMGVDVDTTIDSLLSGS